MRGRDGADRRCASAESDGGTGSSLSLSADARELVHHRREEARLAVAEPHEAVAAHCETEEHEAAEGVPGKLRPFIVRRSRDDTLGVSEAASQLGVSRTTFYDWVDRKPSRAGGDKA